MSKDMKRELAHARAELAQLEALERGDIAEEELPEAVKARDVDTWKEHLATRPKSGPSGKRRRPPNTPPVDRCGAILHGREGTCKQPAGAGTDHFGEGRCKYHGGNNHLRGHGRYSTFRSTTLADYVAHFKADDAPTDITDDLALARALVADYVGNYEDFAAALLAWHESYKLGKPTSKPTKIHSVLDAVTALEKVMKHAQRVREFEDRDSLSRRKFVAIMEHIGSVIDMFILDKNLKEVIRTEIMEKIQV